MGGKDSYKYNDSEKKLISSFERGYSHGTQKIRDWSHSLNLQAEITNKALEIFEKIRGSKKLRGRSNETVLATILFIASRTGEKPLMISEIEGLTLLKKHDIRKCFNIIKKLIPNYINTKPSIFVDTISSKLFLPNQISEASRSIADKISELGITDGKNPRTIASIAIFLASNLSENHKKTFKEISVHSEIAESTIKNTYKDIFHKRSEIIHNWSDRLPIETLPNANFSNNF